MNKRQIEFESIFNFRDLGGYATSSGKSIAYGRIFRSGSVYKMTGGDCSKLKNELKINSVLDLRSSFEIANQGNGLIPDSGVNYFNVSLIVDGGDAEANKRRYQGLSNMG